MKVFRIQDREGRGPWRPGFSILWTEERTPEEYKRLPPIFEQFPHFEANPKKFYGVGCESLEQLRLWVRPSEYETLRQYGYSCYELDADRLVAASDVQCVFERSIPLRKKVKWVPLYE